jgi:hypothetical protein
LWLGGGGEEPLGEVMASQQLGKMQSIKLIASLCLAC